MMRRLVWTFWLALILSVVGTFVVSAFLIKQWNKFVSYSEIIEPTNYPFRILSKEIEAALNQKRGLESILLNHPITELGDVYLIDSSGADVLGRNLPVRIAQAEFSVDAVEISNQPSNHPPVFVRGIKSDLGETFSLVLRFDPASYPFWNLFRGLGLYWVLFAALVVSSLISWWFAIKITHPIQYLALASGRQGEGDLVSRFDSKILQRRDELGELARQLQASDAKIRSLLNKQKKFLRDVSHEVRTPLARLQVAAATLELDSSDSQALSQIEYEVQTIDQLVQDLLHLSHFDRPSMSHKVEGINIVSLLDEFADRSRILTQQKKLTIALKHTVQRGQRLVGVRFLLDRALDNLMTNAIRHSPERGKIRVSCEVSEEYCCLGVLDEGEGIDTESMGDIFEPFVRLDSSRSRQTGGFGLGLSLVKRIAEVHEGTVVASNESNGFFISLVLPLGKNKTLQASSFL